MIFDIKKTSDKDNWVGQIEINTIEELFNLINQYNEQVIVYKHKDPGLIEIYDTYRE